MPPSLTSFPALRVPSDRAVLIAGVAFVEGAVSNSGVAGLRSWFTTFGPTLSFKAPPANVTEPGAGTLVLANAHARLTPPIATSREVMSPDQVAKLMATARLRVVSALRGLLAEPMNDRFLHAAIHSGAVEREGGRWVPKPRDSAALSEIVLSLFAADVLSYREFYEQCLCICNLCGRVSFNPEVTTREGCVEHVQGSTTASGLRHASSD